MMFALLGALLPVAGGIAVGWGVGEREGWLKPARVVALVAALAVAGLVLLPESAEHVGWLAALATFAVGLFAPTLLELGAERAGLDLHGTSRLAVAAVVLHQGVDGFEVGASHALQVGAWGVTLAIAIHSVPLVSALVVELGGTPNSVTGGIWAVVEGTALQRSTDCVDADLGTIWAARPEFSKHIGDFAMALHEVATRAEARWGPTTRRMGVALGGDQTRMDGQVVELSAADVRQALKAGRLDELATLTVSLHRVWDNGTRQWPVATAMARSLAADQDQDQE